MGIQNREPRWKRAWRCFTKWNLCLLYNAVISLLGIYPREMETYVPIKIYTWICIADWVVIAKTWKQPRYPSAGEWLNKLGYMHTTECSSAMEETDYWFIQLDGPPGNVAEWKSQSQNHEHHTAPLRQHLQRPLRPRTLPGSGLEGGARTAASAEAPRADSIPHVTRPPQATHVHTACVHGTVAALWLN